MYSMLRWSGFLAKPEANLFLQDAQKTFFSKSKLLLTPSSMCKAKKKHQRENYFYLSVLQNEFKQNIGYKKGSMYILV